MRVRSPNTFTAAMLSQQAIVDIAVLAMLIDGQAVQAESSMLGAVIARQDAFRGVSPEEFGAMINASTERLEAWGDLSTALVHITAQLGASVDNRIAAFAIVYSVTCADGEVVEEEDDFLSAVADAFSLTQEAVDAVMSAVDDAIERSVSAMPEGEYTKPYINRLLRRGAEHTPVSLIRAKHHG